MREANIFAAAAQPIVFGRLLILEKIGILGLLIIDRGTEILYSVPLNSKFVFKVEGALNAPKHLTMGSFGLIYENYFHDLNTN